MTAIAQKKNQIQRIEESIGHTTRLDRLRKLLANTDMTPEAFVQMVMDQVAGSPKLQECSTASIYQGALQIAELGLKPGVLGHAWLVPFKGHATVVVGYKGWCQLAYQSPRVQTITADVVTKAEWDSGSFRVKADRSDLVHEFDPTIGTPGEADLFLAYCRVTLDNGAVVFKLLNRAQVHERRPSHWQSGRDPVWVAHPDKMWRKSAIRALLTSGEVPLSTTVLDAAKRLEADDLDGWVESGPDVVYEEPEVTE